MSTHFCKRKLQHSTTLTNKRLYIYNKDRKKVKKKMKDKQIRIAVRLPEDLKEKFMLMCKERAINSSELVRQLIQTWINKQENK